MIVIYTTIRISFITPVIRKPAQCKAQGYANLFTA